MNLVSLITFLAGILYVYLGYFGLKFDVRARLNQIFFLLCTACAWWAFCIAFMFPAADRSTAWLLLRLSSPGWCLGPPLILHFTIYLTAKKHSLRNNLLTLGIYIPGLVFTAIGMTVGLTSKKLVPESFGWNNIASASSPEYWAYVVFYLLCIGISIIMLAYWGYHSNSRREKEQAKVLSIFSFLGLLLASGSETLLPLLGITSYPKIPVVMWLFWAYGMWYAISRYRLLILTPEIATKAIVSSITDMMVMLSPQGQIMMANQSVQSQLEYSYDELIHQPASTILASQAFLEDMLARMNAGVLSSSKTELDYQSKTGEKIPVMLSCSAIRDSFDDLAGVILVAQDLRPTRLLELQNAELEAITNDLLETNLILENKSLLIRNIMDNVGQGFLTFSKDLLINDEYSAECTQIFNQSPARKTLAQMLYPGDREQDEFLKTVFTRLLTLEDKDKINLYMPLLPAEIEINNRCISLKYQIVNESAASNSKYVICILTDITEKRQLEEQMEEERSSLRMVVKAIVYYDTFMECINEFKNFSNHKVYTILDGPGNLDIKLAEIFRYIHTFKGNFSQFDISQVVKKLHQAETFFSQESAYLTDENKLRGLVQELSMPQWLDDDLGKIIAFLGEDFLNNQNTFKVDRKQLLELEEQFATLLPQREYALLHPYISRLRYKSFKEMLKPYPEYVLQLAERLGKSINPFTIEGNDLQVDNEYYHLFVRSLVHVFRNMVDHGIEYVDERMMLQKNEIGTIRCYLECENDRIKLRISDDGAGIDIDKIKAKAITSGKYSAIDLDNFSDDQLINLIFEDNFSTSENVNLTSGRGVGLAVVKSETERINGSIQLNSVLGAGTEYIFDLPIPGSNEMPLISMPGILISIIQTIEDFAKNYLGVSLTNEINVVSAEKVFLNKYTAMINIRGVIDGIIIMSYNESLLKEFAQLLITDEFVISEEPDLMEDLAAEATNIILGNSLKKLGDFEDLVRIGIPTVTANHAASIKRSNAQIYTCSIENGSYSVTSSFIPI